MKEEREKKISAEIDRLAKEASAILFAQEYRLHKRGIIKIGNPAENEIKTLEQLDKKYPLNQSYQKWYSLALSTVRQLAADRCQEFELLYRIDKRRELNPTTYGIVDYLQGISTTRGLETEHYHHTFISKFQMQIDILQSISSRVGSILADITGVLSSDLFDNEKDAANELLRNGYLRAAGVVAGVALEGHLKRVVINHNLKIAKKSPTISDYNDALKSGNVIDVPVWRQLQHHADLRNLCAYKSSRDPTKDEVVELIETTKKHQSNIY